MSTSGAHTPRPHPAAHTTTQATRMAAPDRDRREERRRPQPPSPAAATAPAAAAAVATAVVVGRGEGEWQCGEQQQGQELADRLTVVVTTRCERVDVSVCVSAPSVRRLPSIDRSAAPPCLTPRPNPTYDPKQPRALESGHLHHPPRLCLLGARPRPGALPQAHRLRRLPGGGPRGGAQVSRR